MIWMPLILPTPSAMTLEIKIFSGRGCSVVRFGVRLRLPVVM